MQRKTVRARREPTTNSTHIWHRAGIEPGTHSVVGIEASALTTAPSLLTNSHDPTVSWTYMLLRFYPCMVQFDVFVCSGV